MQARSLAPVALVVAALAPVLSACNTPPLAYDDVVTTAHAQPVDADVIANDRDPDGDQIRVYKVLPPRNGHASLKNERTVLYAPNFGFSGLDSFDYIVGDGDDFSRAHVQVAVSPAAGTTLPAGSPHRAPSQPVWESDTVPLQRNSKSMVVRGPFLVKLLTTNGEAPVRFELGELGAPIRGDGSTELSLPLGKLDFFVPAGKALFAQGEGAVAYSGYRR